MLRRPYILIAVAACVLAVGCGGGSHRTTSQHRAKHTTILTEASLGFGAFHRFIWLPARAGRFSDPVSPAVGHAVAAARFTSSELRLAARQVEGSERLQVLFAPLELTADKVSALGSAVSRRFSLAQIEAINEILSRIAAAAKDNGARILDASAAEIAAAGGPRA